MHHWVVQLNNISLNMDTLITMWACMLVLIIFAYLVTRNISLVPGKMQVFGEKILEFFFLLTD